MSYELKELSEKTGLKHVQLEEGDGWTEVSSHIGCCDCGLIHQTKFRVVDPEGKVVVFPEGFSIQTWWERDEEQTKVARETKQFSCRLSLGRRKGEEDGK